MTMVSVVTAMQQHCDENNTYINMSQISSQFTVIPVIIACVFFTTYTCDCHYIVCLSPKCTLEVLQFSFDISD